MPDDRSVKGRVSLRQFGAESRRPPLVCARSWHDDGVKRCLGVLLGLLGLLLVVGGMACGPSFQAIYEGNSRFEHCYALEENAQTAMHDKADCWRD